LRKVYGTSHAQRREGARREARDEETKTMSPLDDFDQIAVLDAAASRTQSSRRLSDKILAAFSHAYAVGEADVAMKLKNALAASEAKHAPPGDKRKGYDPLGQAELWVAFIEARNGYKALAGRPDADPGRLATALESMKDAYRRWSGN
jgi:hypothetical protein